VTCAAEFLENASTFGLGSLTNLFDFCFRKTLDVSEVLGGCVLPKEMKFKN